MHRAGPPEADGLPHCMCYHADYHWAPNAAVIEAGAGPAAVSIDFGCLKEDVNEVIGLFAEVVRWVVGVWAYVWKCAHFHVREGCEAI